MPRSGCSALQGVNINLKKKQLTKRYLLEPEKMNFAMKTNLDRLSSHNNHFPLRCRFQNISDIFEDFLVFHDKKTL